MVRQIHGVVPRWTLQHGQLTGVVHRDVRYPLPGTDTGAFDFHRDGQIGFIEGKSVPDADATSTGWISDLAGPQEFLFAFSVERAFGDFRDLDNCVNVARAVS